LFNFKKLASPFKTGFFLKQLFSHFQTSEARNDQDEEGVKDAVNSYDEQIERFIPILMQQAKIYWDKENYNAVEKIFRKSVEFCNDHDVWKLNVAHVLFMQENTQNQSPHKFKEAAGFYEPIVKVSFSITVFFIKNICRRSVFHGDFLRSTNFMAYFFYVQKPYEAKLVKLTLKNNSCKLHCLKNIFY
jgi:hypothetical protein